MKYFIIAGEASGDLHGANLMRELKNTDREAEFCFLGGDMMATVGGTPQIHYRQMAFMGVISVILNLHTVLRNISVCKKALRSFSPDVLILIDYPSFNLRIAKYAKEKLGLKVFYYISPKLWAWKEYRIKQIKALVDNMLCIFPFEIEFYKKHNYTQTVYVGNPLMDAIESRPEKGEQFPTFARRNKLEQKPIVALLSGSRKKEIADNLPLMISIISQFPEYQFVIAGAPGIMPDYYSKFIKGTNVKIVFEQTYALLQQASAALVTSGTATLETALLNIPQVVTYNMELGRLGPLLYNYFIHTPYFSLVNIITDKPVVKELLGSQVTTQALSQELDRLLNNSPYRNKMLHEYHLLHKLLGTSGASRKAAETMVKLLSNARD
ncbi:MAG: lipid-A-disaccharide synthetase [Bacteroidetes bacterium]|jgi:lipid-A-disaccharide synthase|nr:lipid-A-disaccharide synthetase [Bacteroidota bacterium]